MKRIWMPIWQLVCRTVSGLDDALMPTRCVFCGDRCSTAERFICEGCSADLPWLGRQCRTCAQPIMSTGGEDPICAACQVSPPPFEAAIAPLAFEFPVDQAIRIFKFHRRLRYAPAFGHVLRQAACGLPDDVDTLLPVPLHWLRHGLRGFNQAVEIARPLSASAGLPLIRNVLRIRNTPYQSGATAFERRRNLHRAFSVRGNIAARHVVIVDDVITTGETCRQLALALLDHGVARVSVLAIARTCGRSVRD